MKILIELTCSELILLFRFNNGLTVHRFSDRVTNPSLVIQQPETTKISKQAIHF